MSDFPQSQLNADWGGVCGSTQSGEAFRASSVTYYGVFNQADARYTFDLVGGKADVSMILIIDRAQGLTPTVDSLIFRAFDSVTYRINDVRNDQAVFECDLVKPR